MTSTRSNSGILSQDQVLRVSADYGFRLPMEMWFFNAGIAYIHQNRNLIPSQMVSSDLVNLSYLPHHNGVTTLNTFGSLTKQIQSLRTKLSLHGGYSLSQQSMIQNGIVYKLQGGNFSLSSSVSSKPFKFLEVNYAYTFNKAFSLVLGRTQARSMHMHDIRIDLKPSTKWSFKFSSEINAKEITQDHWTTMCLFDAGATYSNKSLRYSIELNNIFNEQNYSYSVFSGVNTYSYNYALRGREICLSVTLTI